MCCVYVCWLVGSTTIDARLRCSEMSEAGFFCSGFGEQAPDPTHTHTHSLRGGRERRWGRGGGGDDDDADSVGSAGILADTRQ